MDRIYNFSPGPATLPRSVLEAAQRDLVVLPGVGVSPLEVSHRSPWFREVIDEAVANLRSLLAVPDSHHVVFCQGGATQQFSMAPMNLLRGSGTDAEYVVTGSWGARAAHEAEKEGGVRIAWSGAAQGHARVPAPGELARALSPAAAYVHVTTNETIEGVQWPEVPATPGDVPLIADSSSDLLSRPIDVGRFGLLYAGAQKNAGAAGVTIAIVRDDLLSRVPDGLPAMLDYRTFVEHGSMYNTPPVFAIYIVMLVTRWLRDEVGGVGEQAGRNRRKAALLYDGIDASEGFYRGHAEEGSRSLMNVTFRLANDELDARFVSRAAERGLVGLKGHRRIGGIRASIYNAMPLAGAEALAAFMETFARRPS
jgi:phosphoserine aminotransferase